MLASCPSPFSTCLYHRCCHSCINHLDRDGIRPDRHGNFDRDGNLDDYPSSYIFLYANSYLYEHAATDVHLHRFGYVYEHAASDVHLHRFGYVHEHAASDVHLHRFGYVYEHRHCIRYADSSVDLWLDGYKFRSLDLRGKYD